MLTDRERFLALLYTGPLLKADAIVVLAGEDAEPRCAVAAQLFTQGAAPVVYVTGGRNEPPRHLDATTCAGMLYGHGIAPDRVVIEPDAKHTRDQAVAIVAKAVAEGWKRLLVVASTYHVVRAYLTLLRALQEAGQDEAIRVLMVPASQSPWWGSPSGCHETRLALYSGEMAKCETYFEQGHVASIGDGIDSLHLWEGQ